MSKYSISRIAVATSLFLALLALRPLQGRAAQDGERGLKIKVGATNGELTSGHATDISLWAVLIGVSRYQYGDQDLDGNRISNLKHASEDAEAMRDFLMSPEGGGFKEDHIALLEDESATRANVQSALAKLKQAKPSDFFVIYIAAHGAVLPFAGFGSSCPF